MLSGKEPAKSRTMKGRVQDTKDKEKAEQTKAKWRKGFGQFAEAATGVGLIKTLADKEKRKKLGKNFMALRGKVIDVASKVGTGYYINKAKDKLDEVRDGPKGGSGTGVRVRGILSRKKRRREKGQGS
jgi:hypothetical protein